MRSIIGVPLEGGVTELIGADEQVDQNDYSGSVGVSIGAAYAGVIDSLILIMRETGTGAIIVETGCLHIFDADPSVASGDTALAANGADHLLAIAKIDVAAADWVADGSGGLVYKKDLGIPFHAIPTLYFCYKHTGATSINSAAADNEILSLNFWYHRAN